MNRFKGHIRVVYSVVFSPDGRLVISGSEDCTARIWDMTDGSSKILGIADSVGDKATSAAISSDGRLVAAGSYEGVRDLSSFVGCIPNATPIGGMHLGRSHR